MTRKIEREKRKIERKRERKRLGWLGKLSLSSRFLTPKNAAAP